MCGHWLLFVLVASGLVDTCPGLSSVPYSGSGMPYSSSSAGSVLLDQAHGTEGRLKVPRPGRVGRAWSGLRGPGPGRVCCGSWLLAVLLGWVRCAVRSGTVRRGGEGRVTL